VNGFTTLRDVSAERLTRLLDRAVACREAVARGQRPDTPAAGELVALMFYEASTRTRFSFEAACHRLGAHPMAFSAASSSAKKGETLLDSVRTLVSHGARAIVVRHGTVGAASFLDAHVGPPVINAGSGTGEHPTQALLDLLTLRDSLGTLQGRTVAIVGDVRHSRVARSVCHGLVALGATPLLTGPGTLCGPELAALGAQVRPFIDDVLDDADAVMMLRIQRERLGPAAMASVDDYRQGWALTEARAARLGASVPILHPAPMNRGVEIASAVADGPSSRIFEQMANGVFARMAVLAEVMS
jgi:aspartate carbamoyltransferase catalytic subunit